MQTKQDPVDSLNCFDNTVLITVMHVSVLQLNTTRFIYRNGNSIRGVLIYRKSGVYNHYTRQDCPMETTETILQYYKHRNDGTANPKNVAMYKLVDIFGNSQNWSSMTDI